MNELQKRKTFFVRQGNAAKEPLELLQPEESGADEMRTLRRELERVKLENAVSTQYLKCKGGGIYVGWLKTVLAALYAFWNSVKSKAFF